MEENLKKKTLGKNPEKAALFYTFCFNIVILSVAESVAPCTQAEDSAAACYLGDGCQRLPNFPFFLFNLLLNHQGG